MIHLTHKQVKAANDFLRKIRDTCLDRAEMEQLATHLQWETEESLAERRVRELLCAKGPDTVARYFAIAGEIVATVREADKGGTDAH